MTTIETRIIDAVESVEYAADVAEKFVDNTQLVEIATKKGPVKSLAQIAGEIAARIDPLLEQVDGKLSFLTMAAMQAYAVVGNPQAWVWNDPVPENNGLYGWDGTAWVASESSTVSNILDALDVSSPVSGKAVMGAFLQQSITRNLFDHTEVESGSIRVNGTNDGSLLYADAGAKTSGFIPVGGLSVGEVLYLDGISAGYGRAWAYYDAAKNLIDDVARVGGYLYSRQAFVARLNAATMYVRITIKTHHADDVTDIAAAIITRTGYVDGYEPFISGLSAFNGLPIVAAHSNSSGVEKTHALNRRFADDNLVFNDADQLGLVNTPDNLLELSGLQPGALTVSMSSESGEVFPSGSHKTTDYFDISGIDLYSSLYLKGFEGGLTRAIYFYDKDFNVIPSPSDPSKAFHINLMSVDSKYTETEIPAFRPSAEAVYARMTVLTSNDLTDLNMIQATTTKSADYVAGAKVSTKIGGRSIVARQCDQFPKNSADIVTLGALSKLLNPLVYAGKKLSIFGDSITRGETSWVKYVKQILGFDLSNYAESGGHWEDFTGNTLAAQWFTNQIDTFFASGETPDIVVIAMGTNSIPWVWGDFDTILAQPLASVDTSKIYGGMRYGLEKIRTAFPGVPICLCTPLQRSNESPYSADFAAMVDGIKKMGGYYGCTIFDCHSEVGILHHIEKDQSVYLSDGLHPNDAGRELQGRYIAGKIRATCSGYF
jgi:lysophospholipase L1-like esterase